MKWNRRGAAHVTLPSTAAKTINYNTATKDITKNYAGVCANTSVFMYICIYIYMFMHACMYVRMKKSLLQIKNFSTATRPRCTLIHVHTHTHTHTHIVIDLSHWLFRNPQNVHAMAARHSRRTIAARAPHPCTRLFEIRAVPAAACGHNLVKNLQGICREFAGNLRNESCFGRALLQKRSVHSSRE